MPRSYGIEGDSTIPAQEIRIHEMFLTCRTMPGSGHCACPPPQRGHGPMSSADQATAACAAVTHSSAVRAELIVDSNRLRLGFIGSLNRLRNLVLGHAPLQR